MTDATQTPTPAPTPSEGTTDTPSTGNTMLTGDDKPVVADPNAAKPDADKPVDKKPAEGGDKPADDPAKKPDDAKPGAPEAYADFAMPDGIEFNPENKTAFTALAKEYNLPQEAAQKLVDLGTKLVAQAQANPSEVVKQAAEDWKKQSALDKEIGGVKVFENLAIAKKTLDKFGTPELHDLLDKAGLGSHPEVVRLFYRVGLNIKEDGIFQGQNQPSNTQVSQADRLYAKKTN